MRPWSLSLAALAILVFGACFGGETPPGAHSQPGAPPTVPVDDTRNVTAGATTGFAVTPPPTTAQPPATAPPPPATPIPTPEHGAETVVQLDVLVSLALGDRATVDGTGWTLRFDQVVEDSRCPTDVQCIWAGQVVVRLVAGHSDGRVAALTLTIPAGGTGSGVLDGLRVEALDLDPSPRGGSPPPSYLLHLRASTPATPPPPTALSGVRGLVTVGPMCPVTRADEPCPDRPYRALLIVRDAAGREVARVESSDDGMYALPLPPGSYVMAPESPSASRMPWAADQPFKVQASNWTALDVTFDSGIR